MNFKIGLQYLIIYITLAITSISIATRFWWTDSLTLSFANKQSMAIVGSVGIMWLGILFLSIFIIRNIFLKTERGFISPLIFADEDFIARIGVHKAKKVRKWLSIIAFTILFLSIFLFIYIMRIYKENQIQIYGTTQTVMVKEVMYDIKENPYAHIEYYYGKVKYETNLSLNQLKKGEKVEIVFSRNNPAIIKYK
jgi:hypothetical protein